MVSVLKSHIGQASDPVLLKAADVLFMFSFEENSQKNKNQNQPKNQMLQCQCHVTH